jgi:hypothetical protein
MQYRPGLLDALLASAHLDLTAFVTPTLKDHCELLETLHASLKKAGRIYHPLVVDASMLFLAQSGRIGASADVAAPVANSLQFRCETTRHMGDCGQ